MGKLSSTKRNSAVPYIVEFRGKWDIFFILYLIFVNLFSNLTKRECKCRASFACFWSIFCFVLRSLCNDGKYVLTTILDSSSSVISTVILNTTGTSCSIWTIVKQREFSGTRFLWFKRWCRSVCTHGVASDQCCWALCKGLRMCISGLGFRDKICMPAFHIFLT